MKESESKLFSIGDFAAKAGVTLRTLRYYDKIELLKPSKYNSSGHRLYSKQDFARLQKILTLKFIGLSLDEIKNIVQYHINNEDFIKSLEIQKDIMQQKIEHTKMVMNAIDETLNKFNKDNKLNWDRFINIINVINIDKNWLKQYQDASNLKSRIRIHELFSVNKYGWMKWFFDQLDIPLDSKILEVGCGDGSLWVKNIKRIPSKWDITLSDFSQGMLADAKKNLGIWHDSFKFKLADVENLPFEDSSFDVVIANHMLYHVKDIQKAFSEIKRVLKPGGYFFASTVGKKHMCEMREVIAKFDSEAISTKSWDSTEKFQLENGLNQVSKFFSKVSLKRYKDSLIITYPSPFVDYIFSMPGNIKEIFDDNKLKELINFLENQIINDGGIHITKDTGFFQGRKDE